MQRAHELSVDSSHRLGDFPLCRPSLRLGGFPFRSLRLRATGLWSGPLGFCTLSFALLDGAASALKEFLGTRRAMIVADIDSKHVLQHLLGKLNLSLLQLLVRVIAVFVVESFEFRVLEVLEDAGHNNEKELPQLLRLAAPEASAARGRIQQFVDTPRHSPLAVEELGAQRREFARQALIEAHAIGLPLRYFLAGRLDPGSKAMEGFLGGASRPARSEDRRQRRWRLADVIEQ